MLTDRTASNFKTIANSHIVLFTTARTEPSQPAVPSPVSSASVLTSLLGGHTTHQLLFSLPSHDSTEISTLDLLCL
jgi:hypothetical protein